MKKFTVILVLTLTTAIVIALFYKINQDPPLDTKFVQNVRDNEQNTNNLTPKTEGESSTSGSELIPDLKVKSNSVNLKEPGEYAQLINNYHVYQSFNNCGPATLSMAMAWYGVKVSQEELAKNMRPFQHPKGDNDDKTIFTYEFVNWANEYGLEAIGRVNGDIELLKKFISNGIPVVVKTWLKPNEDIGHFRFVTGYDENKQIIVQDDSYEGPNKKIGYYDFLSMWQVFNYSYVVVYTSDLKDKVESIIGEEVDEKIAWENALKRAEEETLKDENNLYPHFNISTASYHLGDYERSVKEYEKIENNLPRRMLWYQIEPIKAYQELGDYDKVFEIIEKILENGNRSFSELYVIRGEIYLEQGLKVKAKEQFELALKYNENQKTTITVFRQLE
ncbi:C39 family peptidase [Patescibacteria group bacterium]|nr:C39 family peptidase [Patescibacteria group bacterium]